ncbi:MAG: site-specific integrase [Clostridiales bacterium]|jgi:integrase|nr:site-specific integrase [Clostridiales bacterium]
MDKRFYEAQIAGIRDYLLLEVGKVIEQKFNYLLGVLALEGSPMLPQLDQKGKVIWAFTKPENYQEHLNRLNHKQHAAAQKPPRADWKPNKIELDKVLAKIKKGDIMPKLPGITISSRPRSDGRFEGKYTYKNGKRRAVYGGTYAEVAEKLIALLRQPDPEKPKTKAGESGFTFASWLDEWYSIFKAPKNGAWNSVQMRRFLDNEIIPALGAIPLKQIDTIDLQNFINHYTDRPNTQHKIALILNGSLEKARKMRKIEYNPFEAVELIAHKRQSYHALEFEEQQLVFDAAEGKYRRLFFFACCTGIRIRRILELAVKDFDPARREITVLKKQLRGLNETYAVPYLPPLIELPASGRIFPDITYSGARQYFDDLFKRLNIKRASLHSFRHTFISVCYHIGVKDKQIQAWAGHATLQMTTDTYTHLLKNNRKSPVLDYLCALKDGLGV